MIPLQELMTEGNLNGALNYLLSNYLIPDNVKNDIILLIARLTENERKELLNIENSEKINIERNRIGTAVLFYGSKYQELTHVNIVTEPSVDNFDYSNFIGMGNEPGWSLRLSNKNIIFISDYGTKVHAYEITKRSFGKDIWYFRSIKPLFTTQRPTGISVVITKEPWEDDMSGHKYSYRIELTEDFRHHIGTGEIKK